MTKFPEDKDIHIETDHAFLTIVMQKSKVERMADEVGGIKVMCPDPDDPKHPMEFRLQGFNTIKDAAGVKVIHYKIKVDAGILLYCLTDHPDTKLGLEIIRRAMGDMVESRSGKPLKIQDVEVVMREAMAASKKIADSLQEEKRTNDRKG